MENGQEMFGFLLSAILVNLLLINGLDQRGAWTAPIVKDIVKRFIYIRS